MSTSATLTKRSTVKEFYGDIIVKSAARTLEVFELFSERREPATVGDVARLLRYPLSSTSKLMHTLYRLNYLAYEPQGRTFYPSVRIAMLAAGVGGERAKADCTLSRLVDAIHNDSGLTVTLGVQNSIYVQYVTVRDAHPETRRSVRTGTLCPLHASAMGKALLAPKTDKEIDRLLRRISAEVPGGLRHEFADLTAELAQVRRAGFSVSLGGVRAQGGGIAALLPKMSGLPPMAISVVALTEPLRERETEFKALLREHLDRYRDGAI